MSGNYRGLSQRVSELLGAGRTAAAVALVTGQPESGGGTDSGVLTRELVECGRDFFAVGEYRDAVACFERALRLAAATDVALLNDIMGWLGLACLDAGDAGKAESVRTSTHREDASASLGLTLFSARCLASDQQPAGAIDRLFETALNRAGVSTRDQVWLLLERGRWLRHTGRLEAAAADYRRAGRLAGLLGDRLLLAWGHRAECVGTAPADRRQGQRPKLYVRLLGQFGVNRGGQPVSVETWRRRKAAQMLQVLALQPQWRAPRSRVIELLWGGDADADALHVTAHALRHGLCEGLEATVPYLLVANGVVALEASLVAGTDVQEFRACIQAARTYWTDDREAALQSYRQARAVYAGELLAGVETSWVLTEREILSRMYVEAVTRLAKIGGSEGLEMWLDALELEPANAEALEQSMILLAGVGRKKQAIDLYRRYHAYVDRELGLVPAPALERLFRQLKGEGRELKR